MMDPSEKNSFEEQWKKAFQEASETPPLSAWEGIEARLDKEERKVVPLWWQTPRLWYAAASVAALLMVGIGLWNGSFNSEEKKDEQLAAGKSELVSPNADTNTSSKNSVEGESAKQKEAIEVPSIQPETGIAQVESDRRRKNNADNNALKKRNESLASADTQKQADEDQAAVSSVDNKVAARKQENNTVSADAITGNNDVFNADKFAAAQSNNVAAAPLNPANLDAASRIVAEALTPIGYKDLDVYVQKRYVFFKADATTEKPVEKAPKNREYYAAVGLMPATFNPDVKVTSAPAAFASANASRQSLSGNSHAGTSYAVQTQGGKRLSKHWSVETGVSYLQGNSTYEGGGYLLDAATSRSQNVLQSALMDKSGQNTGGNTPTSSPPANSLYIDVTKDVRNDYRYLQVPVQAGYTLNPDKKFSYSVLGGMMANFFMNNEIESASGTVITTTASDDVYRSLNWAATTGLRFNYRLSSQWKATLTGSYQKSITSGFKSNETLESRPYLYGVSWGVRYSF
ncbi:outer membrane beta-barrel protein [Dyadobacter sp. CY345]|uniref:outer membrane beta-barrel protein n=1 Tax=Dyadobacter sp. CY345 TaxID=2909335 RepID=UPI001F1EC46C|nr:outer membrane beta-barrel protein [Dyadobacter sp. CY345]MCF2445150.1 outer membrane beta-barrel protein [Dyadobacter sp. CY345]